MTTRTNAIIIMIIIALIITKTKMVMVVIITNIMDNGDVGSHSNHDTNK